MFFSAIPFIDLQTYLIILGGEHFDGLTAHEIMAINLCKEMSIHDGPGWLVQMSVSEAEGKQRKTDILRETGIITRTFPTEPLLTA